MKITGLAVAIRSGAVLPFDKLKEHTGRAICLYTILFTHVSTSATYSAFCGAVTGPQWSLHYCRHLHS